MRFSKTSSIEEADVLRGHGRAAAKDAANAGIPQIDFLAQGLEQFGRGEERADLAVLENGDGLLHHMVHVGARHVGLLFGDDPFDPAGIQVNKITGTAAKIGQVLDGQAQPAGAGRADHQPGAAARKMGVGKFGGEFLVIRFVIVPADALLGHAGGAAGFKNIEGAALEFFRDPDFRLQVAQPFVLKVRKALQAAEAFDFSGGIPAGLFRPSRARTGSRFRGKNAIGRSRARGRQVGPGRP